MSALERTLRLPYLIQSATRLLLTRTLLLWVFFGFIWWLILHRLWAVFRNKTVDADQSLWEAAQEKNPVTQKKLLDEYLEIYGSRVDDWDISLPTLRERPKAIESLLALSKLSRSPNSHIENAVNKREQSLKQVRKQIRVPVSLFNWLTSIVQKNVNLREDRRYWEFQGDYYLRQMLRDLAKRIHIPDDKLFTMTWKEVSDAANR